VGPPGSAPSAPTPAFAAGRAEYPGNPYYGGPTGPAGAVQAEAVAPGDTPGDSRRRNATVAALVAAVLIGVVGLVVAISLGQGASQADTQPPPNGTGGDRPVIGNGPRDLPGRTGNNRQGQPAGPLPGGTSPSVDHGRTRTSATAAPTTAPTSPEATATTTTPPAATTPPPTSGSTANPYTAKQVCGSAFAVIDSVALKSGGVTVGKVVLMYNSANGKNCAVTLKTTQVGAASAASAYLEVQGGSRSTDSGSFQYYAGPVKASAAGVCVKWGGSVGGVAYDSPFEHCD
jgi:serine/threonine-protein kinase